MGAPTSVFFVFADLSTNSVELLDLLNGLVIERNYILAANICSSVLLQKQQLVSNDGEASKNSLFAGIPRCWYRRCIHRCIAEGRVP